MEEDKNLTMGVTEQFKAETPVDEHVEEISRNGYTILKNVLSQKEIEFLKSGILERIYQTQINEIGGEDKLLSIGDELSAKALLAYDDYFAELAINRRIHEVVGKLLGENYKLGLQNAVINMPGDFNPASVWHRDIPYTHFVSTRPLAVSSIVVVDEFNEDTGGTVFLPGSHKHEEFPSIQFVKKHAIIPSADAGSVIISNSMIYHRAGFNKSGRPRRAIVQLFTHPLIEQTINFSKLLNGRFKDEPLLNKLIGYHYGGGSSNSVLEYRLKRIAKRAGKSGPGDGRLREFNNY